jgi:hypothetical protein
VGYDISPLKGVKFKFLATRGEWRNIVTHGQLKENQYIILRLLGASKPKILSMISKEISLIKYLGF